MGLANTYSRRLRASQPNGVDVYQYDEVPDKVRVQIVSIVIDLLGDYSLSRTIYGVSVELLWKDLCLFIAKDGGIKSLQQYSVSHQNCRKNLENYIEESADLYGILDFCDLLFIYTEKVRDTFTSYHSYEKTYKKKINQAIEELNTYFQESSFGYEYNNNQIIRIDSQHIHKEVIKPILQLLRDKGFKHVDKEYRLAHEHCRNKHIKDCIVACNRAFESMLKTICDVERWECEQGARASDLITLVRKNDLFLDGMANNFNSFVAMLKNGVLALRNDHGGHGEGNDATEQPLHMAQYMLNLTASNLLFLHEAWNKYSSSKQDIAS